MSQGKIIYGENLSVLKQLQENSVDLIYIDPPFNTGKVRIFTRIKTRQSVSGVRRGFGDKCYETSVVSTSQYDDRIENYLDFLRVRLEEAYRILSVRGSLYLHCDYREAHYIKIMLDEIFGRENFINEIIWAYDFGGRSNKRWAAKHDTIFFYVKDCRKYFFDSEAIDRIPYMSPQLVGKEKAARGKLPTDVWWHTIVPTNSRERTNYPTQKPLHILKRILSASSKPGDLVLDFFAGSGTTGIAAYQLGRNFILVDNNIEALKVMTCRFAGIENIEWVNFDPGSF